MMVKNILCPIDRSPSSLQAFDYAIAIARWREAQLILLEVIDTTVRPGAPRSAKASRVSKETRTALETDLNRVLAARRASDVRIQIVLREGNVVKEILAQARTSRSDLIVIGSHGSKGVQRPIGSIAERVLRVAHCPVLTVRRGVRQSHRHAPPFVTILCPTDFSAAADRALACAKRIAKLADATLIAMNVVELPLRRPMAPRSGARITTGIGAVKEQRLARLLARGASTNPRIQALVAIGRVGPEIVAHGLKREVDLVVMGISGRNEPGTPALGSATHHVVRKGACPVLTVR